jgi:hypothetical protein
MPAMARVAAPAREPFRKLLLEMFSDKMNRLFLEKILDCAIMLIHPVPGTGSRKNLNIFTTFVPIRTERGFL